MMRFAFASLALVCAAQAGAAPAPLEGFTAEMSRVRVPLTRIGSNFAVDVHINGKGPYSFLIDTGASRSALCKGLADSLDVRDAAATRVQGLKGEGTDGQLVTVADLAVAGLHLREARVLVLKECGAKDAGILGYDWLSQASIEFDFLGERMVMHDPGRFQYTGPAKSIPMHVVHGSPVVNGNLAGIDAAILIDTGNFASLHMSRQFAETHDLLNKLGGQHGAKVDGGVDGDFQSVSAEGGPLDIGNFRVPQLAIRILPAKSSAATQAMNEDLILGMGVMGQGALVLDQARHLAYLESYRTAWGRPRD